MADRRATEEKASDRAMIKAGTPKGNHLLAALPEAEWNRWLPQLEAVDLPLAS